MNGETVAVTALLCLLLAPFLAQATEYIVDSSGGGDFTTVQEAVDVAQTGDIILIRAGHYLENVLAVEKYVSFIGEGIGATILEAADSGPAVRIEDMPYPGPTVFQHMSVMRHETTDVAVSWNWGWAELSDVDITGRLSGGGPANYEEGWVVLSNSTATSVRMGGGWYTDASVITGSSVGEAQFQGTWEFEWCYAHNLESSSSEYGSLHLGCASLHSQGDIIGELTGGSAPVEAVGSQFGVIDWSSDPLDFDIEDCTVSGGMAIHAFLPCSGPGSHANIRVVGCLIEGDVSTTVDVACLWPCSVQFSHNTITGQLSCEWWLDEALPVSPYHVRSNIVLGDASLGSEWIPTLVASHNDVLGTLTVTAPSDSVYGNISVDPLFCGPGAEPYTLQECSPCVGAGHDGESIGAYGIGCECEVAVHETSWGAIKAMFRQPPN